MKERKSIFILLSFLIFAVNLHAQNTDSTKIHKSCRFSIGIVASPDYCYRLLSDAGESINTPNAINFRNDIQMPKFSYTAGLSVTYEINKRISLLSGISYSNKGYQLDWSGLTFGDMIDPRFGFIYEPVEMNKSSSANTYNYTYIDIPLKLQYTFPGKKFRFTTEAGLIANIFLDAYTISLYKKYDRAGDFNAIGISACIGAGAIYHLNEKFRIICIPAIQYSLTNLETSPINEHLYSAGVNVGGYYRF